MDIIEAHEWAVGNGVEVKCFLKRVLLTEEVIMRYAVQWEWRYNGERYTDGLMYSMDYPETAHGTAFVLAVELAKDVVEKVGARTNEAHGRGQTVSIRRGHL